MNKNDSRRIRNAVIYIEEAPRNRISRGTAPRFVGGGGFVGITTTTVTKRVGTTLGAGSMTIYSVALDGTMTTTVDVPVFNASADKAVNGGSVVVGVDAGGVYVITFADCGDLS